MKASICITTRDHSQYLDRTLASIFAQNPPFEWEVIVIDDGANDNTNDILYKYNINHNFGSQCRLKVQGLDRLPGHTPGRARNIAMKMAKGDVIIQQSDDVIHVRHDTIERLTLDLQPETFIIGTVHNYSVETGEIGPRYTPSWTGSDRKRPLFFLGSSWREDIYKIGGYDPDFTMVGSEDVWITDCLIHGLKLRPIYSPVLGLHQDHPRANHDFGPGNRLRDAKMARGIFCSSAGPWEYKRS